MGFHSNLMHWYSTHRRDLPWRETKNPYAIWLSEIILQQTQVKQGLPYYEAFLKHFPTVFDLADAKQEEVLKLWQGLGYYSRARHLHSTAQYVAYKLKGVFPKNYNTLIQLKGVGDYTASAIASICYEEGVAVLDGNVFRVLSRHFGIETPINSTSGIKEFKTLANSLLPKNNIGAYNQAIMEFGALQCTPKSPVCSECPMASTCVAIKTDRVALLPHKIKTIKRKKRFFNFLVFISKNKKTILEQRVDKGIWHQLYQFPLIESSSSISKKALLLSEEFKSKTLVPNESIQLFENKEILHKLTHQDLFIKFWVFKVHENPKNSIDWSEIYSYPVPKPIEAFINRFSV